MITTSRVFLTWGKQKHKNMVGWWVMNVYKDHHLNANWQNTVNYFALLCDKLISWQDTGHTGGRQTERGKFKIYCHPCFNANTGGGKSVMCYWSSSILKETNIPT
jgi:hypothetical protein